MTKYDISTIKAVALDLDGTTLNPQKEWSNYTKAVLNALHDKGIHIVVATGRGRKGIGMTQGCLNAPIPYVLLNGAMLVEPHVNVTLHGEEVSELVTERPILNRYLRKLHDLEIESDLLVNFYTKDKWYCTTGDPEVVYGTMLSREPFIHAQICDAPDDEVLIVFIADPTGGHERLAALKAKIEERLSGEVEVFFNEHNAISICGRGVTKLSTLRMYLEKRGLCPEANLLSFGDNQNDYQTFLHSKLAFYTDNHSNQSEFLRKEFARIPHLHPIGSNQVSSPAQMLNELFDLGIAYRGEDADY